MKTYSYLLLCFIFFSCGQMQKPKEKVTITADSLAVPRRPDSLVTNPASVEQIKQHYANINDKLQRGQLDSTLINYDCHQERTGNIVYFSYQGKLVMIKHTYNEYSHFSAIDHYYISNNKLYFAHLISTTWAFESGQAAEGATKDDMTEQRLYINNQKPLLCLEKKYTKRSSSTSHPNPANLPNKQIDCKAVEPVLKRFKKLLEFKNSTNHNCLPR